MKRTLILIAVLLAGCTNASDTTKALESMGYTDVEITGYRWFGCADDDEVHTGFHAKGQNGKWVTGVVCGQLLFKGSTVRFD